MSAQQAHSGACRDVQTRATGSAAARGAAADGEGLQGGAEGGAAANRIHLASRSPQLRVLFVETYYNKADESYPVLCIDAPIQGGASCASVRNHD